MSDESPFPPLPPDEAFAPDPDGYSSDRPGPFRSGGGERRRGRDERRPRGSAGRVPPHNLQAEESVLGALLLDRDAIGVAAELGLQPGDFYKPAHQHIYDAIRSLFAASSPVDVVTVADELRRAGLLP